MHGDSPQDTQEASEEDRFLSTSSTSNQISKQEFSCHCCYDVLVNPTTLTCGHNFCRHCLALWWKSSHKNECPECRERWEGFPKVNILLREATDKLFSEVVQQRQAEIQANTKISQSLQAFQRYGNNLGKFKPKQHKAIGFFLSGVFAALSCVAVLLLLYQWSSGGEATTQQEPDLLVSKPVSQWTPAEVVFWLENLGPWANLYREPFLQESVNGRLLLMMEEEELRKPPYSIQNQAHRRTVLTELYRVKSQGLSSPQNLWEYKTEPCWEQWTTFMVKYFLLPYQLIAEFAWDWLSVHYWTSLFVIVNAVLLSVLEACLLWNLRTARLRTLPSMMGNHLWTMLSQGLAFALMWPLVPQLVCNCLFYWALFISPIMNVDRVVQQLTHPETAAL
ncbi:bifunctional apoptosis regulator-like isoform X2 [Nerophis lumbriciformis]|uniref:bifunctional apoptosis regulator-like isoform X2 n=1 Tax=Nerophis lumbriciformis TaxID=546530 RepID=UPI003BAA4C25